MSPSSHIILASTSPRRRELLKIPGIPFVVVPPEDVDETPLPNESPANLVQRLSQAKAQAIINNLPSLSSQLIRSKSFSSNELVEIIVIAADTVVVLNDKILGKPNTPTEATQMLKRLCHKPHYVYSGLTVACSSKTTSSQNQITCLHQSKVWMRPYTNTEIAAYVAGGSPMDKAGAYGIQDQPFAPVAKLEGCFASIMGLPLAKLAAALEEMNISLPKVSELCTQYINSPCCQITN